VASLLENLIKVLDSENSEYKKLVILADSKTPVIVAGDIDSLEKIMEDEQAIVGTIQKMEKQRNSILADIANVVNRDVKTLKLIDLINMLEKIPDQQKMLKDVQAALRQTIDSLRAINDKNQLLLNDKLEMVNFNLNMIRAMRSAPQTANYTKNAYNDGQALGIFHGGFDTKQ
jgi:flagellar biosynthesis/type III secretory pathway chaperone